MKSLQPLSTEQFVKNAKSENYLDTIDYEAFFATHIKVAVNFAVGPFFWFIGDNANMKITIASDNIGELTPFCKSEWENKPALFFVENLHQEDSFYVLSAIQFAVERIVSLPKERQSDVRINIYARMLNADNQYRWILIQMPGLYVNNQNKTTCGLIMITDLTHFNFKQRPILMTLIDKVKNKSEYYHIALKDELGIETANLLSLTKREQEIIQQMIKGLNTPQIATALNISYNTVENHKRNLRTKTTTKTSAELIHFVMQNNML